MIADFGELTCLTLATFCDFEWFEPTVVWRRWWRMLCLTFFTAGFAAGVAAAGGLLVACALAFIASPDLALTALFDDFVVAAALSGAFTVAELVAGVVLVDLPSAARAGAVNSEAASKAAEICFNMVSSCFRSTEREMPFPFVIGITMRPAH